MSVLQRIFRLAAIAVFFVLVYTVVIAATPLAVIVIGVQLVIHKMKLTDEEKVASTFSILWFFLVAASGMVINLLCIPLALLWCWLFGKPMPHPLD